MTNRYVIRDRNGGLNAINAICNQLGETFKPHILSIRKFESVRSIDQNSKIHVMIRELAEHTGYSENEMKQILKIQYGPLKSFKIDGPERPAIYEDMPKSTTEYTRPECSDFIERLYQLGAEIGCVFSEDPA